MGKHYFTVEEAQAALALIRPVMVDILVLRDRVLARQPDVWPAMVKGVGNGGNKAASAVAFEFEQLDALVRQVLATGAVLKDINSGLVDFLSWRDGQEVYLCWQYGEDRVRYWHTIDGGFAARQEL